MHGTDRWTTPSAPVHATMLLCVQPRWRDVFDRFPSLVRAVPLDAFLSLAPRMPPRYYRYAHKHVSDMGCMCAAKPCMNAISTFSYHAALRLSPAVPYQGTDVLQVDTLNAPRHSSL
jgi:hypothetical protein